MKRGRESISSSLQLALSNGLPMQAAIAYRVLADLQDFKADYSGGPRRAIVRDLFLQTTRERKRGTYVPRRLWLCAVSAPVNVVKR